MYVLDLADRLISKACPFAAAGIMVGSIYWTAVTYGAVTVMQVSTQRETPVLNSHSGGECARFNRLCGFCFARWLAIRRGWT